MGWGGRGKKGYSFLELSSLPIQSKVHKPRLHQSALRLSGPDSGIYGAVVLETPQPEDAQAFTTKYSCQPLALIGLSKSKASECQAKRNSREVCLSWSGGQVFPEA